ncbi:hypothetical protein EYZ11_007577 [Aspergillus tanneri]|uniref:Uncharacterized protein n=1 Tax=Aspergillus tanneri TaxID=1220188 RepID=A0A4V3UNY4_9EURO|nr:hypothetical protein EYZ11_007577 [Aspergillus tanneri]
MYPLGKTFLHNKKNDYADRFLQEHEFFPWLKQDASLGDGRGLSGLDVVTSALGFGYPKSELEFYLTILQFISDANKDASKLIDAGRVYDLYKRIEARCHESVTPDISRDTVRLIYLPAYGDEETCWTLPDYCLWEAPADMNVKYSLRAAYDQVKDTKYIIGFFRDTLSIPDAGVYDFLDELAEVQGGGPDIFDHVYNIYQELYKRRTEMDSDVANDIR